MHLFAASLLCMTLFALNSVLCRAALICFGMDSTWFTVLRILSASAVLIPIAALINVPHGNLTCAGPSAEESTQNICRQAAPDLQKSSFLRGAWEAGTWSGAFSLFFYMAFFSLGYTRIQSAPGALVLFAGVQFTMVGWGLVHGSRPTARQFLGLGVALAGLAGLLLPGSAAPSVLGAIFMLCAGISWGIYSALGTVQAQSGPHHIPALVTAGNFWRCSPFAVILVLWGVVHHPPDSEPAALLCALCAGAVASAMGYVLWYRLVPRFSLIASSTLQLSVPLIAAVLAVLFLGEPLGKRLILCGILVLGGIFLVIRRDHS